MIRLLLVPLYPRRRAPALPRIYGSLTLRTLRAVIRVLRPHDGAFRDAVDRGVLHTMLSFVPFLPLP